MNTEFLAGVLVARMLEGVKFALGPTIVARKQALADVGGFPALSHYLAEDFVMGSFAAAKGWKVTLSSYIIEHRIGSEPFAKNASHRLRWNRSTRRSRPAGYIGQLFTNPLPTGSPVVAMTMGIAVVAFCAAPIAADASATIMSTFDCTNSAARPGKRSGLPSAKRGSSVIFRLTMYPWSWSPCLKASTR